MIAEGAKMPAVTVQDDEGREVDTQRLLGDGPLVLWFYPKDDTPGWTNEAQQFRDEYAKFQAKKARIVGVSCDSVESHQAFKKKYSIPFALLADTDGTLCDAFGVPHEEYPQRSTFLIDADGTVRKVWPKVSVQGHALDVLANL